ncbi:hypothetical protein AB1L30_09390 [Bremerella sp. JC817]|uniref:hypothetical protein n=1 Tax=Bremerella sp. JC817 TaxID=3231756 RepID=UPI003457910D
MMEEHSTELTSRQFSLGGFWLWLTLVLLALGMNVAFVRMVPENQDVNEVWYWIGSLGQAWLTGSFLFCLVVLGIGIVKHRPIVIEPGTIILLAVGIAQLPNTLMVTYSLLFDASDVSEMRELAMNYLIWGVRIANYLKTILFVWACWKFRKDWHWLAWFGWMVAFRLLTYMGLSVVRLASFGLALDGISRLVNWDLPAVILVVAVCVDISKKRERTWLHRLGVASWFLTLLMAIAIRFIVL